MSRSKALLIAAVLVAFTSSCAPAKSAPSAPVNVGAMAAPVTATLQPRDLYRTVRLEGRVEAYDPLVVTTRSAGSFIPVASIPNGSTVTAGQIVGRVVSCSSPTSTQAAVPAPGSSAGTSTQGVSTSSGCPVASVVRMNVKAPVAGTISRLSAQDIQAGGTVGSIQPPGLHIRLPVTDKSQLYNFVRPPRTGKAELLGGPAGFVVTFERTDYHRDSGGVEVYTTLPSAQEAYPGIAAVVVFVVGTQNGVMTLPLAAVKGQSGEGDVVVRDDHGTQHVKHVTLGASDDNYVEVRGLAPTTKVLLYPTESDFAG